MRFLVAFCLALSWSGSHAAAAALSDLREARSLVAEAALVLRLEEQHRLSQIYVQQSLGLIRDQLESDMESLGPVSPEAGLVRKALGALDARDRKGLEASQRRLTGLVDRRE